MLRNRIGSWIAPALFLGCALVLCGDAAAQESPAKAAEEHAKEYLDAVTKRAPQPGDETRVFVLQHARPRVLAEVLQVFPATITYSKYGPQPQQALAVSASPAVVTAIEETIKRLDRPPAPARSIILTAYILEALADPPDTSVPPVLEAVVAQLREAFRYQGYRVIDSLIARTREDAHVEVQGVSAVSSPLRKMSYALSVRWAKVIDRDGPSTSVRVNGLEFDVEVLHETLGPRRTGFETSIEIGEGQQVVVGKAGLGGSGNALLLVLSAEVTD